MYIDGGYGYYGSGGEQRAARGHFLILMECRERTGVRAIIRKVALRQLGHWMMGRTHIGKQWYSLSGAYGHDGLLLDVQPDAWDRGVSLPPHLYRLWNKGGGWNSCGSEAPMMREFGLHLLRQEDKPCAQ